MELKASGVCKSVTEVVYAKEGKGICKIETDKVMTVYENVLSPRLSSINSDSLKGESVYSNSMSGPRNELITGKYIMYVHMHTFNLIFLW